MLIEEWDGGRVDTSSKGWKMKAFFLEYKI